MKCLVAFHIYREWGSPFRIRDEAAFLYDFYPARLMDIVHGDLTIGSSEDFRCWVECSRKARIRVEAQSMSREPRVYNCS